MVVKSKKTSQKGGGPDGRAGKKKAVKTSSDRAIRERSPSPYPLALARRPDLRKKEAAAEKRLASGYLRSKLMLMRAASEQPLVEVARPVLPVRAASVPANTYMENLAVMVERVLGGKTPTARSTSVEVFSVSVSPERSLSPGPESVSQPPLDMIAHKVLRGVVPLEKPENRFDQITRVIADAAVHDVEFFLEGSRMAGQVIKGIGIVAGEAVGSVLNFLVSKGGEYGRLALEYLKTNGRILLEAGRDRMAGVHERISVAAGISTPELVAALRLEGGNLPGVALTMRIANAVGSYLGPGFAEYGGAAASWCGHYLYSFGYYLLTAPTYLDIRSLLPVLGEVINYSIGVISGGMITAVPFGTVVQATIFIMTALAVYDYLTPGATGLIGRARQLLIDLLKGLSRLGRGIVGFGEGLITRIRTLSEHQFVIYVLELYKRATYMAGQPGFYSIAALIKLVAFLAPRVQQTPVFARRLVELIKIIKERGANRKQLDELDSILTTARLEAAAAAQQPITPEEAAVAEAAAVETNDILRRVVPGGGAAAFPAAALGAAGAGGGPPPAALQPFGAPAAAAVFGEEAGGGAAKGIGGAGRIRKSRKSSSKKGKSGKKGGAKVKTAKRSTPSKKSKGKKAKKSKKN